MRHVGLQRPAEHNMATDRLTRVGESPVTRVVSWLFIIGERESTGRQYLA